MLIERGHKGTFGGDENVLYIYYSYSYASVNLSKLIEIHPKWVYFIICKICTKLIENTFYNSIKTIKSSGINLTQGCIRPLHRTPENIFKGN